MCKAVTQITQSHVKVLAEPGMHYTKMLGCMPSKSLLEVGSRRCGGHVAAPVPIVFDLFYDDSPFLPACFADNVPFCTSVFLVGHFEQTHGGLLKRA
jgi:hypothetical protein